MVFRALSFRPVISLGGAAGGDSQLIDIGVVDAVHETDAW